MLNKATNTAIRKKSGKYIIYNFYTQKQLTKSYDYIEKIDKDVYKGINHKKQKYAFLSMNFSTPEIYRDIKVIFERKSYGNIYIGIIDENNIEVLSETGIIILSEFETKELLKLLNCEEM